MFARRSQAGILVVAILSLVADLPTASASPARRLARRGVVLAPPPGSAILPPAGPLRPNPLLAVPIAPGGPAIVIGPNGRVRRRLAMPAVGAIPGGVVTVAESVSASAPAAVTGPAAPAVVPQQAVSGPVPAPGPLVVESIPAPLPAPRPAPTGGVVPTGGELEIPDGTQSVLVPSAGGAALQPAGR